jgi:peptide/nickel transport system substrate-binding protein
MKKYVAGLFIIGLGIALAGTPKNAFVEILPDVAATLDPSQAYDTGSGQLVENLYDQLLGYKGADIKTLVPLLATEYKASNAAKTWTFTLRKNVKFQNGDALTCDDAAYTFRRAVIVNNPNSWGGVILGTTMFGTTDNANADKSITWERISSAISCNSSGQLVFKLSLPDASMAYKVAYTAAGIISQKYAAANGEWSGTEKDWKAWVGKDLQEANGFLNTNMMGAGPYQLISKSQNQYVFKAFTGYWGGKPDLENVILQVVPEEATRILALQKGDADSAGASVSRPGLKQLEGIAGVKVMDDLPNLTAQAIFMNQNIKDPAILGGGTLNEKGMPANFFSDLNVRKGFVATYDYNRHINEISLGKGKRRTMALPETFIGYDPTIPLAQFNLEKAKGFFKKAFGGKLWETGFTAIVKYNQGNATRKRISELLKAGIEAVSPKFHLEVQVIPFAQFLQDQQASRLALSVGGWGPDYPDPDNFIPIFYGSAKVGGYYSPATNFESKTIDSAIQQARQTTDTAKREALYKLIGRIGADQVPFILLPRSISFLPVRDDLKGVYFNNMLSGLYLWKDLSK